MSKAGSSSRTSKEELIGEHIPYEVSMLYGTHAKLLAGGIGDQLVINAFIESFCIHARQLIDFFNDKQGVPASDFTESRYELVSVSKLPASLTKKLDTQIALSRTCGAQTPRTSWTRRREANFSMR